MTSFPSFEKMAWNGIEVIAHNASVTVKFVECMLCFLSFDDIVKHKIVGVQNIFLSDDLIVWTKWFFVQTKHVFVQSKILSNRLKTHIL